MPLKDIVVGYSNGNTAARVLNYGIELAKQFDAQITATHVHVPIAEEPQIVTWMPEGLMEKLRAANSDVLKGAKQSFDTTVIESGFDKPIGWSLEEGDVNDTLATVARYFDLLVIGKYAQIDDERGLRVRAENIVTHSGRPVLVIPPAYNPNGAKKPVTKVAVAWDGSYSASRALFDAVQLFTGIENIEVISVVNNDHTSTCIKDISRYLSAHNIKVNLSVINSKKAKTADAIVTHCQIMSADLLVIGNRGRARLREGVFGSGLGHDLIEQSEVPVFVSN